MNPKKDNTSQLFVQRIIGQFRDGEGKLNYETKWEMPKGDVSLGSIKNPKNQDIIGFQWVDTQNKFFSGNNPFGFFFDKFFGGGD